MMDATSWSALAPHGRSVAAAAALATRRFRFSCAIYFRPTRERRASTFVRQLASRVERLAASWAESESGALPAGTGLRTQPRFRRPTAIRCAVVRRREALWHGPRGAFVTSTFELPAHVADGIVCCYVHRCAGSAIAPGRQAFREPTLASIDTRARRLANHGSRHRLRCATLWADRVRTCLAYVLVRSMVAVASGH